MFHMVANTIFDLFTRDHFMIINTLKKKSVLYKDYTISYIILYMGKYRGEFPTSMLCARKTPVSLI